MATGTTCCSPTTPSIRATLQDIGSFTVNTIATLIFKLADASGNAQNTTNLTLTIFDQNNNQVLIRGANGQVIPPVQIVPEKITTGFYVFDWYIDPSILPGNYTVIWTYSLNGTQYNQGQSVNVSPIGIQSNLTIFDPIMQAWVTKLQRLLGCLLCVPIYREPAKTSQDCQTYCFTKGNWNINPCQTKIYRNDQTIINNGLTIDYDSGTVIFDSKQSSYDTITADYSFSWFTENELAGFIQDGVQYFNAQPPASGSTYSSVPLNGIRMVVDYAAVQAMRRLYTCLTTPENRQLMGGSDAANQIASMLNTMKQNYQLQIATLVAAKKLGPYPRGNLISTPTLSLVGGRSRFFRAMFSTNI